MPVDCVQVMRPEKLGDYLKGARYRHSGPLDSLFLLGYMYCYTNSNTILMITVPRAIITVIKLIRFVVGLE